MRTLLRAAAAGLLLLWAGGSAALAGEASVGVPPPGLNPDVVTIYTAEGTRGYRVIWLCEELGIPYKAIFKPNKVGESFVELRKVNPMMGQSPTIFYHGVMMIESGAILEYF